MLTKSQVLDKIPLLKGTQFDYCVNKRIIKFEEFPKGEYTGRNFYEEDILFLELVASYTNNDGMVLRKAVRKALTEIKKREEEHKKNKAQD